jgi:hypothetical protein
MSDKASQWTLMIAGIALIAASLLCDLQTAVASFAVISGVACLVVGALLPRLVGSLSISPTSGLRAELSREIEEKFEEQFPEHLRIYIARSLEEVPTDDLPKGVESLTIVVPGAQSPPIYYVVPMSDSGRN